MKQKLPYYMAYPISIDYDNGRREQRDIEYLRSLYPEIAKRILPYIEEECDKMEYRFSMMYDDYPDRLQLRLICSRIYDKISFRNQEKTEQLRDLIEVMMYHELYKRRCDNRRLQSKLYFDCKPECK